MEILKPGRQQDVKPSIINEYKDKKIEQSLIENDVYPDYTADSLLDAVSYILKL